MSTLGVGVLVVIIFVAAVDAPERAMLVLTRCWPAFQTNIDEVSIRGNLRRCRRPPDGALKLIASMRRERFDGSQSIAAGAGLYSAGARVSGTTNPGPGWLFASVQALSDTMPQRFNRERLQP